MKNTISIQLILLVAVVVLFRLWRSERAESERLEDNQTALITENLHYKTKEGKEAASVLALTLKCNEYERLMAADAATIRSLGLKVKNLESVSQTQTSTDIQITTPIVEAPVVGSDSVRVMMRTFDWADAWVRVKGLIRKDSVLCEVHSVDTLLQVVHRIPHRFLFFRWGTKELRQEIVSSNPHTAITYSKFIKLER